MRITKDGWAIIDDDTHLSKWIETSGQMDHGLGIAQRYSKWFGPGDTVIDVGASLGDHTIPYAEIVGEAGKVYAFEPNQEAFECLLHNIRNYPQIECFDIGLSNIKTRMGFNRLPNLGASHLLEKGDNIEIMPLDDINIVGKVKFIKIDVEGLEFRVLQGATELINFHKPVIMLEIGWQERFLDSRIDIFNWLSINNYTIGLGADGTDTSKYSLEEPQYDLVAYPK